jgi:Threonine dehydrogenase and related Zn-dependent dehydrogenases
MLSAVYQLRSPRQFEITFQDITVDDSNVIVRPTYLSICNADQRYYQGLRPKEILRQKLPMALVHEGIGEVVYDPTGTFTRGEAVVMIPNQPIKDDDIIAENYLRSSKFSGSSMDGFMQEYIKVAADRLVSLPANINKKVAAFTELVSVSFHAILRFEEIAHTRRERIGVWGDGNLGYITALLLKKRFPESEVVVMGMEENKLSDFTFADETILVNQIPADVQLDHAFECVGGNASSKAINQIIDYLKPEGTIAILGVSEDLALLNTRMILEKGLRVFGTSRSGRSDFEGLIKLWEDCPEIIDYLENLVGSVITVRKVSDMVKAFETDIHKVIGKTIMVWEK